MYGFDSMIVHTQPGECPDLTAELNWTCDGSRDRPAQRRNPLREVQFVVDLISEL
jgi:hypothetical protein